jgi:SAM-dependent methyltransferase
MIVKGLQEIVRRWTGSKRPSIGATEGEKLAVVNVGTEDAAKCALSPLLFIERLSPNMRIADLGSGPNGAFWWDILPQGCEIEAYDLYNIPMQKPSFVTFHQVDVTRLHKSKEFRQYFDLIVADHIFEHVAQPQELARSITHIIKPGGLLHVGIPDASNFTDRFYRLIHPDGGGHIAQFTRESFLTLIGQYGFKLVEGKPWPDDWLWFERLYTLEYYKVAHLTMDEKRWLADVFRKELTPEKGYYYGWEFLLRKSA